MKKLLIFISIMILCVHEPYLIFSSQVSKNPPLIKRPSSQKLDEEELAALKKELEASLSVKDFTQKKIEDLKASSLVRFKTMATNYTWDYFKNQLNELNPNRSQKALVKKDAVLSYNEKLYITKRMPIIRSALENFFGYDISDIDDNNLLIGFVGTGGGYRAMILTTGYLSALQDIGLYDGLTYMSALSGSSWSIAPMVSLGLSPQEYKTTLLTKIQSRRFNLLKLEESVLTDAKNINNIVDYIIFPKFVFGQPIRSIDLYGFLLSQVFFGPDGYKEQLSGQWDKVRDGKIPFPLYTAISMSKKDATTFTYDWYEFNPVDVRVTLPVEEDSAQFSIPTYSFASEFSEGKSVAIAPEQPFGYLLGIFGSAYAINFKDINRFVSNAIDKLEAGMFSLDRIKYFIAASVVNIISSLESSGKLRFSPAQVFNPFKGYSEVPKYLQDKELLTMVDAGIAYNIPARPLLWPARKLKVLIIGESSSAVGSAVELKKLFADAQALYGYHYTRIDDGKNKTIRLYKDLKNTKAPRIIYITFFKDQNLIDEAQKKDPALRQLIQANRLDTFDPTQCVENSFCGTFNFEYTPEEFKQLSGMAEFNIKANEPVIKNFLHDEIIENLEDVNFPTFGGGT
jgi:cytosolic phospholipase A2